MRDAGPLIVLVISLIVFAGIVLYLQRGSLGVLFDRGVALIGTSYTPAGATAKPDANTEGEEKEPGQPAKRKTVSGSTEKSLVAKNQPVQVVAPTTTAAAASAPPPFPNASDIRVGMERAKLLGSFVVPSLRTSTVAYGDLVEVYVYLRRERNAATYVQLINGKVVAATSTIY